MATAGFNIEEARTFLSRLAPPAGHFLELRFIEPDGPPPRQDFFTRLDAMVACVGVRHGKANVYVGAVPRCRREGKRTAVSMVVGVWADIDFHLIDDDRDVAEAVALQRLAEFPLRPTMIVFTGNGLQGWWLFREPVVLGDACPAERIEAINRGLQVRLGGDAVWDLARVLRVPGTLNLPNKKKLARGCVPVMARLLDADGPTNDVDDFRDMEVYESAGTRRPRAAHVELGEPDLEVYRAFMGLLERLGPDHPVVQTWRGERAIHDTSRSGWDWALARELARLRVKESFVVEILRAYPLGRGPEGRHDYLQRTARKARGGR